MYKKCPTYCGYLPNVSSIENKTKKKERKDYYVDMCKLKGTKFNKKEGVDNNDEKINMKIKDLNNIIGYLDLMALNKNEFTSSPIPSNDDLL